MAKSWTGKEQKACALIYKVNGLDVAMKYTNRSRHSVIHKMKELGKFQLSKYDVTKNLKPIARKFYAEDVANMFELANSGIKSSIIGEYYNTTSESIRSTMSLARKNGLSMYPLRSR